MTDITDMLQIESMPDLNTYAYICGPMAKRANLNREAFEQAAEVIRRRNHVPVIPHEIPAVEHPGRECPTYYGYRAGQSGHDPGCFLRGDIAVMVKCHYIYRLEGWEDSVGATAETKIAEILKMTIEDEAA